MEDSYRIFNCARCSKLVHICPRCDRGNRYCSAQCAEIARDEKQERSRRKYEASPKGLATAAARMKRWRKKQREQKTVTYQGPPPPTPPATSETEAETIPDEGIWVVRCDFCGRPCLPLARRKPLRTRRRVRVRKLSPRYRRFYESHQRA